MFHPRWALPLTLLLSLCPMSFAQVSDWAVVKQLSLGQKVQVDTTDGKSHVGKIRSVGEDELLIGKSESLHRQDVQRVRLWSSGHHGRNTIIGLGVGAASGAVFGAASCGGKDAFFSRGACAAFEAPLFGGIGAGIGAIIPSRGKWQDVYQVQ